MNYIYIIILYICVARTSPINALPLNNHICLDFWYFIECSSSFCPWYKSSSRFNVVFYSMLMSKPPLFFLDNLKMYMLNATFYPIFYQLLLSIYWIYITEIPFLFLSFFFLPSPSPSVVFIPVSPWLVSCQRILIFQSMLMEVNEMPLSSASSAGNGAVCWA